jgi:hypothetical protein
MKQLRENKFKSKKTKTDKENEPIYNTSEMPVLSDSLLRRIQTNKQSTTPVKVNHTLLPSLPNLSRQSSIIDLKQSPTSSSMKAPITNNTNNSNSFKLKTTSSIALTNSINNMNKQLHSAKYGSKHGHHHNHQLKKLNKTKFSALNNFQLNEFTSSSSSFTSSGSAENQALLEDILDNGFNLNTKDKFNEKIQHNLNPQSSLLKKLRMNDFENTSKQEIFVRPIAAKTTGSSSSSSSMSKSNNDEKNLTKHKIQPFNINLAPLIKNFRMSSFDLNKFNTINKHNEIYASIPTNSIEFNIDHSKATKSFDFNFKPFKPYQDLLKNKPASPIPNFEMNAHPNNSLKPIDQNLLHNKSINYLTNGIFDTKNSNNPTPNIFAFKSSSYVSLNRKLDLDDIEYYDFNELFKNNNQPFYKIDNQRKQLSQINEESTISNTPMSDSRWSSSLSTNSMDDNQKMESILLDEGAKEELWSANSAHTNQFGRPVRRNSRPLLLMN